MRKQSYKVKTQLDLDRAFKKMSGLLDDKWKRIQFSDYTEKRSEQQNALAFAIYKAVGEHIGETVEETRAFCKLSFGVPIRCLDDDDYCEKYERVIRPMSYEDRLAIMMKPLDFPVTRDMNTKQLTEYVDTMTRYYSEQGINLSQERG